MQDEINDDGFVFLPNGGKANLKLLWETILILRDRSWKRETWKSSAALVEKRGSSTRKYKGQNFDSRYFEIVEDGWTHDHCEICSAVITNATDSSNRDGFVSEDDWLCKTCFQLFVEPAKIGDVKNLLQSEK